MKIFKTTEGIIVKSDEGYFLSSVNNWDAFMNRDDLFQHLTTSLNNSADFTSLSVFDERNILAPIGSQEVWAAGVTYLRSRHARVEESKDAGGGTFYDRVYEADRPEIFFKATPLRVVGHQQNVRIRKDSNWNVPEPELTLFITSSGTITGYTAGNDMSSRSIEGENPLYLPQAKTYDGSAALGPCIYIPGQPIDPESKIKLSISRRGRTVFEEEIAISRMKRSHTELKDFLFRECSFPNGCFLMTGTGIIPENDFTLEQGDEILITIDHIGTLTNHVA